MVPKRDAEALALFSYAAPFSFASAAASAASRAAAATSGFPVAVEKSFCALSRINFTSSATDAYPRLAALLLAVASNFELLICPNSVTAKSFRAFSPSPIVTATAAGFTWSRNSGRCHAVPSASDSAARK